MLSSPVPGTAAQVLSAILRENPSGTPGGQATFSLVNFPELPSLGTEVVWLPQYAVLDANGEFTGMLVSQGWATKGITAVTAAYTPQPSDAVILCDATAAAFTVTLPDATQPGYSPGQRFTIVKTDSSGHAVTVATSAGQLINGGSSVSLSSSTAFTSVVFDGVNTPNWWIWAASATGSGSPTGAAGGSLTGTYPNPGLVAATTSVSGAVTFDGTAADIAPCGVQAAGSVGKAADSGHVHPFVSWLSNYQAFSGATAETYPRVLATTNPGAGTSGTLYVMAIGLPKGLTVNNLTFATKGTALTGLAHGWYVLMDSGMVVRAVTADQTSGSWMSAANTPYTLATNSYTTPSAGVYYVGVMANATGMPLWASSGNISGTFSTSTPAVCGTSSTGQTTPPTTGTTMAAISQNGNFTMYAYTS